MTGHPSGPGRSGWWLALAAVPVLCCAGPALLAALGAGGVGAVVGGATGSGVLALVGVLVVVGALALLALLPRGGRRR